MHLRIQFFSLLKDLACASELPSELPAGSSVGDLLAAMYRQFPRLREWDSRIRVGVGLEFVERDHRLCDGDEVAIMPPVQGG